ncbi:GIY-YIG nuclease family protein [Aquimarina aquimarini]|uniref:GIY-YIG nuclease family protein n=1 Tax=Aquimarina aquimarini TaxID=1191734 RepID=UPI000D5573C5|nr:GIY-YIG nuclease family protein [Aquimarina aquimarini]
MKKINALIYSFEINKIDTVYLIGKNDDYYKLYLKENFNYFLKIDLKREVQDNFIELELENVPNGNLTQKVSPKLALELLNKCKWPTSYEPYEETLLLTKQLLNIVNFKIIKKKIDLNQPFFFWVKKQVNRDDLIGDLAYDICGDRDIGLFKTYKGLESYIKFKQDGFWEIESFKDYKKEGSISPLLCLKLAKMEYDVNLKKEKLKKFRILNTKGFVYFLKPENKLKPIKIGGTKNIKQRVKQLQTSLPYDLEIIGYIETSDYIGLERKIHMKYNKKRIKREWFDLTIVEVQKIISDYNTLIKNKRM